MKFYKYHALGNAYIVMPDVQSLTTERIRQICDVHVGVGSDGILLGDVDKRPFSLTVLNPDGSEAETSGNGLRIFARFLYDQAYVTTAPFPIQTATKVVQAQVHSPDLITVEMGKMTFQAPQQLTANGQQLRVHPTNIGNPHCVILCDDPPTADLAKTLGAVLEVHPVFPNRTNVQFLYVRDRANIQIEIWERGAGYTLASGSSSCAAAAVAHRLGLCDEQIQVHMVGGVLQVEIGDDYEIVQSGAVVKIAEGLVTGQSHENI